MFEDDFPFPKVGYVSSLEGNSLNPIYTHVGWIFSRYRFFKFTSPIFSFSKLIMICFFQLRKIHGPAPQVAKLITPGSLLSSPKITTKILSSSTYAAWVSESPDATCNGCLKVQVNRTLGPTWTHLSCSWFLNDGDPYVMFFFYTPEIEHRYQLRMVWKMYLLSNVAILRIYVIFQRAILTKLGSISSNIYP